MEEEARQRISVKTLRMVDKIAKTDAPVFIHAEIRELYNQSIRISHETLRAILNLPRQTLITDLENVLFDAQNRYGYFSELENDEDKLTFPIHALFLLKELNAHGSLPAILEFIGTDEEFLDFWLGDHLTSTLWQCFFNLGKFNLALLRDFLLKPGICTYSKVAVAEALCQLVLHHPEFREKVRDIYLEVFLTISEASDDDNLIDSDFIGLAISDAIDCGLKELLPVIKKLYDEEYVAIGIVGRYQAVKKAFKEALPFSPKRDVFSIFELYDDILSTWAGYQGDNNDYQKSDTDHELFFKPPVQARSLKIGRNEPCPCGSGKKYKKCCMI
jgi:tetratricopeptide (TPR) repeat protein